jgi:hypothetical protein
MKKMFYPSPGVLPSKPAPRPGETVMFSVSGLPPFKDLNRSIRNPDHPHFADFLRLREAAIVAMNGREWFPGPIRLDVTLNAPKLKRALIDYVGGIQDTLDGSHGPHFTYLPICYQDDCQVSEGHHQFVECDKESYSVQISFL